MVIRFHWSAEADGVSRWFVLQQWERSKKYLYSNTSYWPSLLRPVSFLSSLSVLVPLSPSNSSNSSSSSTPSKPFNSVNSVSSKSAVLPPTLMVFLYHHQESWFRTNFVSSPPNKHIFSPTHCLHCPPRHPCALISSSAPSNVFLRHPFPSHTSSLKNTHGGHLAPTYINTYTCTYIAIMRTINLISQTLVHLITFL